MAELLITSSLVCENAEHQSTHRDKRHAKNTIDAMHISMHPQSKRFYESTSWEGICTMIAVHSELAIT